MNVIDIVSITKPNYQEGGVNNNIIKGYHNLNHCFNGDMVEINDNKVIRVVKSNIPNKMISGVLHINSKYKFGFNRKKMPIYRFTPFDWKYPDFMVATSMKGDDKYVIIQFMNWENKFPSGKIVKVYDKFSYDMLLYKWDLYRSNIKFNLNIDSENFSPVEYFSTNELLHYQDCRAIDVFSIDPYGSKDLDDALSIENIENRYRIGIHIADVSFYIKKFKLDKLLEDRYTSIYLPDRVINMLPEIFSNNICSLLENKDRLAYTIWIIFNDKYEIIDYSYRKTIICNKKQYNYKEADEIFINKDIYNISKYIGDNMFNINTNRWDTHKMIEVYMLLCNHLVAIILKNKNNAVYRIHTQKEKCIDNNIPDELTNIMQILQSNSAEYILLNDTTDFFHNGLNIKYYTHFTSPIRRIVDIYIHQLLNSETDILNIDCNKINNFNKNVKKMERDINKHIFIQSILQKEKLNYEAYIIKIDEKHLTIYIPSVNIIYRFRVFDKLLDNIIESVININKINYINKLTMEEINIKLYQKYNITIHSKYDNRNINIIIDKLNNFY